ncbi:MAG TPA: hypothetical protein VF691_15685 [Cytophagaceae bacterium]|jgi:hypothetical protein
MGANSKSLFFTFQFLFFTFFLFAQKIDDPGLYNDFVVGEQKKVINKISNYTLVSVHEEGKDLSAVRKDVLRQLDESINRLKGLSTIKGDHEFKTEAINIFELLKESFTKDFTEIDALSKSKDDSFTAMQRLFMAQDKIDTKIQTLGNKFLDAQNKFARKYKINLKENTDPDPLLGINDINKYSRQMYLEYFRVYAANADFLNAMNQQQTVDIANKRKEVINSATLALNNISNTPKHKGDLVYKEKTYQLVVFHKNLASKEYLELEKIILKKEKMVDQDVESFNAIINKMNNDTQAKLDEFTSAQRDFLKRNIPKSALN